MSLCLDTNIVIQAINGQNAAVRDRLEKSLGYTAPVSLPAIVLFELHYGIRRSARPEANRTILEAFLALNIEIWSFDEKDAEEAGAIRAELARAGAPIGPYDVLIAAQARRRDATVVTGNTGEFMRVAGLRTIDWTKP